MYRARNKNLFRAFYLPYIQDINNRVALSICKNMLNPSYVINLSQT